MRIDKKRKVTAADEAMEPEVPEVPDEVDEVDAAETDLLFEASDVAELLAEVTGEAVDVTVQDDGESVDFAVGDDVFTIQAEGDEEILETSRRSLRGKRPVAASRNVNRRPAARTRGRRVAAQTKK